MKIDFAKESDKQGVMGLWSYAFNEQYPFLSWYFDGFWTPENTVVAEEEQGLAGSLEMIPYTLHLHGQKVKASYIVGVGVLPEHRGKGISKEILKKAMSAGRQRGEVLSLLTPFAYEFYRNFGYELCYSYSYYECRQEDIDNLKSNVGTMRQMSMDNMDELNQVYEAFMRDKNGYILRDKKGWKYIFGTLSLWDGFLYGFYDEENQLKGYLSYVKSGERFKVKELVYLDCSVLYDLLGFVSAHFSVYDKVQFDMPSGDNLHFFFKNPRAICLSKPSVMARVIHIEEALRQVNLPPMTIKIIDDFFPENNGVYEVTPHSVQKKEKGFDCQLDIRTFTQLYMGFLSVNELEKLGKLCAPAEILQQLEKAFPKKENYIYHIMTDDF